MPTASTLKANMVNQEIRDGRIARIENQVWLAVFTHRSANIRLISVRKARQDETQAYEDQQDKIQDA